STVSTSQPAAAAVPSAPPNEIVILRGRPVQSTSSPLGLERPGTSATNPSVDTTLAASEGRDRPLPVIDAEGLVARGDLAFGIGDIAAARLFYERAAEAGNGQAAIRLGESFDPLFLSRSGMRGVRGDSGLALQWYKRARD